MTASSISLLSDAAILQQYQSKVRPNNFLDKSQQDVIDHFQSLEKRRMLVSAPTSYGKTFIMREILFLNHEKYRNVLLVFPTVALLRENALNMEEMNRECEMGYHVIKSIDSEIDVKGRNIFVFTPERAMQLIANYADIRLDFSFMMKCIKSMKICALMNWMSRRTRIRKMCLKAVYLSWMRQEPRPSVFVYICFQDK